MSIFIELGIILCIATLVSVLTKILRQPLIVGYIVSGILVGPYFLDVLVSQEYVEVLSKIGIAILLFIVGLSLSPSTIKENGKVAFITGFGQILFTSIIGFALLLTLGFDFITSLYVSVALTFSSTIIILKLLSDRGDLGRLYGRISIGFLLVQDIFATLLLVMVPLVGVYLLGFGESQVNLFSIFWKSGLSILGLFLLSKYILPSLTNYLAKSGELLFLFSLAWGLIIASLFHYIGLSIEIGALIAGITLSVTNFSYEISSKLKPIRDFFIILFFILLGSQLILGQVGEIIYPAIILSLFVLIGNPIIVFVLMNLLGYRDKVSFMAGLTVAQISEFSLILMALGLSLGHINTQAVSLITLVGIITISGSTYMIIYADELYFKSKNILKLLAFKKNKHIKSISNIKSFPKDALIFGFGNVGYEFVKVLKEKDQNFSVIDYDPNTITKMGNSFDDFIYGDAEDIEFLDEIRFHKSKMIISTIPSSDVNLSLLKYYRKKNKDGVVIVTSHGINETRDLYQAGATYVVMPHFLGAHHASLMIAKSDTDEDVFERARNIQSSQLNKFENYTSFR